MADIDKIAVNNTTYNIKDSTARDSISKRVTFDNSVTSANISQTVDNGQVIQLRVHGTAGQYTLYITESNIGLYDHTLARTVGRIYWTTS